MEPLTNMTPYFPFLYPLFNTSAGDYRFSPLQRRGKLQTSAGVGMVATIYSSAWVFSKIMILVERKLALPISWIFPQLIVHFLREALIDIRGIFFLSQL